MKCLLTLEDVVFTLNQDEDILVKVVDYETGQELIKKTWKTRLKTQRVYEYLKVFEAKDVSPFCDGNNVGLEITVEFY